MHVEPRVYIIIAFHHSYPISIPLYSIPLGAICGDVSVIESNPSFAPISLTS